MTPEGRIKSAADKTLKKFPGIYRFRPVPSGYGKSTLDEIICLPPHGLFVAIEYKAPGNQPTDRQWKMIGEIQNAGGVAFVCDSIEKATTGLEELIKNVACSSKRQTQDSGGPPPGRHSQSVPNSKGTRVRWVAAPPVTPRGYRDDNAPRPRLRRTRPNTDSL